LIDRYEQAKISTIVAESQEIFHIGLKYNEGSQSFKWVSGEDVTYTNWGNNQPGDKKTAISGKSLPLLTFK